MKPKQWVKYIKKLEKKGYAICDGISEPMSIHLTSILYPLFLVTGIGLFITILYHWEDIKRKIKGGK